MWLLTQCCNFSYALEAKKKWESYGKGMLGFQNKFTDTQYSLVRRYLQRQSKKI